MPDSRCGEQGVGQLMTDVVPIIMIQARSGSTRLPHKVLAELCGETVLAWVINRCFQSVHARGVAVLTSDLDQDDPIAEIAVGLGAKVYRGSEEDVLSRYVEAAQLFQASVLVRVTADCPFIDPEVIDEVISLYHRLPADYVCVKDYPEGLGAAEVLQFSALQTALARTTHLDSYYREHVMTYLTDHVAEFEIQTTSAPQHLRRAGAHFSIDTYDDLEQARRLATFFHPSRSFHVRDILAWMDRASDGAAARPGRPLE